MKSVAPRQERRRSFGAGSGSTRASITNPSPVRILVELLLFVAEQEEHVVCGRGPGDEALTCSIKARVAFIPAARSEATTQGQRVEFTERRFGAG